MRTISSYKINGKLSTLVRISFPLMLFLFFEVLATFFERVLLTRFSMDALHGSLNAGYLATIFQSPCIAIGVIAQIFVGFYYGKKEYESIGPCIWQFIWLSFLSYVITLPLSLLASSWYFKNTSIQKLGTEYFMVLILGNGLFPLNAALSSFYLGRGKTCLVTSLMLISYALHLCFCWLLIPGIHGVVPALGVKGAAISKCLSLCITCLIFFSCFLNESNRLFYKSNIYHFSLKKFLYYIRPGITRAFAYLLSSMSWALTTYVMIQKEGDYLNVLTVGGTITTFLCFITKGGYQGMLTIASNMIGEGKISEIWKLCRSFIIFVSIITALLSIPLLLFPKPLFFFFNSSSQNIFQETFLKINIWIWLYIFVLTMQMGLNAILIAFRDIKCQLFCSCFLWPISLIPVYFGLGQQGWEAHKLWAIMILENVVIMMIIIYRLRWIKTGQNSLKVFFTKVGL